ncbi:unnamed protein product, partial [marine sediment metagenome]
EHGKGLLTRLERLNDAWFEILNRQVDTDSDLERWKTDYTHWKEKAMLCIKDVPLMSPNIKRSGYNDEHISLTKEGDKIWKTIEVEISRVQTEL